MNRPLLSSITKTAMLKNFTYHIRSILLDYASPATLQLYHWRKSSPPASNGGASGTARKNHPLLRFRVLLAKGAKDEDGFPFAARRNGKTAKAPPYFLLPPSTIACATAWMIRSRRPVGKPPLWLTRVVLTGAPRYNIIVARSGQGQEIAWRQAAPAFRSTQYRRARQRFHPEKPLGRCPDHTKGPIFKEKR